MSFNEIEKKAKHYKDDKNNIRSYIQHNVYERINNELISLTQIDKRHIIFLNKQ